MAENQNRQVRRPINRNANVAPAAPQGTATAPQEAAPPTPPTTLPKPPSNMQQIKDLLLSKITAIRRVIPPGVPVTAEGLVQNALQFIHLGRDPKLKQVTPKSVLFAVLAAASIGLDLVADQGYLVAMEKKKADGRGNFVHDHYYCVFWAGYKGLITVSARAGFFLDPHEVRANDSYECYLGTRNEVIHAVGFGDRGDIQGFYCIVRNDKGLVLRIERMDKAEVDAIKQDTDPWKRHYDRMGLKTVCKRAYNLIPKNTRETKLLAQIEEHNDAGEELDDLLTEPETVGASQAA